MADDEELEPDAPDADEPDADVPDEPDESLELLAPVDDEGLGSADPEEPPAGVVALDPARLSVR